jgi:hypothetical protein
MSLVINLSFFANNNPSNPKQIPILLNPIEYQNLTAKEVEKLRKDYSLIDFVLETIKENTKN